MMGVGKSTKGKKIANLLGYTFIDLDNEIEYRLHKTIKEISELVRMSVDRLISLIIEAGIEISNEDDIIDEDRKIKLLSHLRRRRLKNENLPGGI